VLALEGKKNGSTRENARGKSFNIPESLQKKGPKKGKNQLSRRSCHGRPEKKIGARRWEKPIRKDISIKIKKGLRGKRGKKKKATQQNEEYNIEIWGNGKD